MSQSAEPWHGDDLVCSRRGQRCNSASGRVLPLPEVSPIFVVIVDVVFQQSSQVPLVQNDHVFEQIATHTSGPTPGDAVLQGLRKAVWTGSVPFCLTVEMTSAENLASRSKIRNRCGGSYPQASRSCNTIHKASG
jgi:hypothetical protein